MNNKHQKIREVLIKYNSPEFGDIIVDEICRIFNYPTTEDLFRTNRSEFLLEHNNELKKFGFDDYAIDFSDVSDENTIALVNFIIQTNRNADK